VNQSVERSLIVLEQLARGEQRLGDLAGELGTHKSTVLRILQTLESRGFVRRRDNGAYVLGLRVVELGTAALAEVDLRSVARSALERLASASGETVHLAVLDRDVVIYVDKVESTHPVRMYSRIGAVGPVHCTGVGKVLLAYTDPSRWPDVELRRFTERTITSREALLDEAQRIRALGWGTDEREHEETIRCIAAPAFDSSGGPAAALSMSVPTSRMSQDELQGYVPQLLEAARTITRELGGNLELVGPQAPS
jgi:DNA-binding IclR family transcriptional regulator